MRPDLKDLLLKLEYELPSLLRQWSPCYNASDYQCAFCYNRPKTNHDNIIHDSDCTGYALSLNLSSLMED